MFNHKQRDLQNKAEVMALEDNTQWHHNAKMQEKQQKGINTNICMALLCTSTFQISAKQFHQCFLTASLTLPECLCLLPLLISMSPSPAAGLV